jgi:hypothetical protein
MRQKECTQFFLQHLFFLVLAIRHDGENADGKPESPLLSLKQGLVISYFGIRVFKVSQSSTLSFFICSFFIYRLTEVD